MATAAQPNPASGVTQPDSPVYDPSTHSRVVQFPHPTDPTQPPAVVAFPDTLSEGEFQQAARDSHKQLYPSPAGTPPLSTAGKDTNLMSEVSIATGKPWTGQSLPETVGKLGAGAVEPMVHLAAAGPVAVHRALQTMGIFKPGDLVPGEHSLKEMFEQDVPNAVLAMIGESEAGVKGESAEATRTAATTEPRPTAPIAQAEAVKAEPVKEPVAPAASKTLPKPAATAAEAPKSEAPTVPTFFSKAERVAAEKVNTGSGDSILSTLRNNGVKESEIQWTGLDDYLKGKSKVSKADVQQYLNEHKISLEETTKGGPHAEQLEQLGSQRNQVFAENNRIWANSLRREPLSTDLFNEMAEKGDPESVISRMPTAVQAEARRFVETDQQIHAFDKQLADLSKQTSRAKFEKYSLPGEKSNYSEMLLRLPDQNQPKIDALNARLSEMSNRPSAEHEAHPEWKDEWDSIQKQKNELLRQPEFKSGHFDEPNVLAHVRFDDRVDAEGKKTLFLNEVQSDWHQKGKREGYRTDTMKNLASKIDVAQDNYRAAMSKWESLGDKADRVSPEWKDLQEADRQLSEAKLSYNRGQNAVVPDAPFKNDWHELVMKRMLRHAAENGYDKLAWTTGEQQAARYDLSKQVSKLEWHPVIGSGDGKLWAFDHAGNPVMQEQIHPSKIADYVGKDAAQKLLDAPLEQSESGRRQWRSVNGVDLKVGGDWAKALYDRAIPNFLNKYGKRWGAKVGETEILSGTKDSRTLDTILRQDFGTDWGSANEDQRNKAIAVQEGKASAPPIKVHSIDITPKMKHSVMTEGQPIAQAKPSWADAINRMARPQAV